MNLLVVGKPIIVWADDFNNGAAALLAFNAEVIILLSPAGEVGDTSRLIAAIAVTTENLGDVFFLAVAAIHDEPFI